MKIIKCPKCGEDTKIQEQIKLDNWSLKTIAEEPQIFAYCEYCDIKIPFIMKIKDRIIKSVYPIENQTAINI